MAYAATRTAYAGETGQRNRFRADGYFSLDPGVSKSFHITERQSLKLTVEAFNVTNASRFSNPASGSSNTSASFGVYNTTSTNTALLNSPRQMQFAGRYYF